MEKELKTKKEDQRSLITERMIKEAFYGLLQKEDISKINVKKLCEEASINRGTFYLYYKDIYDLKDSLIDEYIEKLQTSLLPIIYMKKEELTDREMIKTILKVLKDNDVMTKAILNKNLGPSIIDRLVEVGKIVTLNIYPKVFNAKDMTEFETYYNFVSNGAMAIIIDWIKKDFNEDVDSMSKKLEKLLKASLNYFEL